MSSAEFLVDAVEAGSADYAVEAELDIAAARERTWTLQSHRGASTRSNCIAFVRIGRQSEYALLLETSILLESPVEFDQYRRNVVPIDTHRVADLPRQRGARASVGVPFRFWGQKEGKA